MTSLGGDIRGQQQSGSLRDSATRRGSVATDKTPADLRASPSPGNRDARSCDDRRNQDRDTPSITKRPIPQVALRGPLVAPAPAAWRSTVPPPNSRASTLQAADEQFIRRRGNRRAVSLAAARNPAIQRKHRALRDRSYRLRTVKSAVTSAGVRQRRLQSRLSPS